MDKCREEFENWFLSTPTGKALSAANLGYYIFERHFDEYRDRDVEMAYRAYAYQQAKVEELQKRVGSLTQTMEEVLEEMKYPTATFEEVIVYGVKMLEQALKGEG